MSTSIRESFPADGVWIVQKGCTSASCIGKIEEIPNTNPFSHMMFARDDLASFLLYKTANYIYDEMSIQPDGSIRWVMPPTAEQATDIIKFLAKTETERKMEIQSLARNTKLNDKLEVCDKDGIPIQIGTIRELYERRQLLEKEIQKINDIIDEEAVEFLEKEYLG